MVRTSERKKYTKKYLPAYPLDGDWVSQKPYRKESGKFVDVPNSRKVDMPEYLYLRSGLPSERSQLKMYCTPLLGGINRL